MCGVLAFFVIAKKWTNGPNSAQTRLFKKLVISGGNGTCSSVA